MSPLTSNTNQSTMNNQRRTHTMIKTLTTTAIIAASALVASPAAAGRTECPEGFFYHTGTGECLLGARPVVPPPAPPRPMIDDGVIRYEDGVIRYDRNCPEGYAFNPGYIGGTGERCEPVTIDVTATVAPVDETPEPTVPALAPVSPPAVPLVAPLAAPRPPETVRQAEPRG